MKKTLTWQEFSNMVETLIDHEKSRHNWDMRAARIEFLETWKRAEQKRFAEAAYEEEYKRAYEYHLRTTTPEKAESWARSHASYAVEKQYGYMI